MRHLGRLTIFPTFPALPASPLPQQRRRSTAPGKGQDRDGQALHLTSIQPQIQRQQHHKLPRGSQHGFQDRPAALL